MVGDEIKVPVPSLFVPISYAGAPPSSAQPAKAGSGSASNGASAAGASPSGGTSIVTWIIAGSLIVIMGLLVWIAFRRKSTAGTAAPLLLISLAAAAPFKSSAQSMSPPLPIVRVQVWVDIVGPSWKAIPSSFVAFQDLYKALTATDQGYWPQYTPPGMPGIPTACVSEKPIGGIAMGINEVNWSNPKCEKCYEASHKEIEKVLQRFEKLRRVNGRTKEVYDLSMTFGNGVAMVGGIITTAEWMKIRNGIKENMAKYYVTYDAKVVELTDALVAALQKVGACELEFFNNPSWYDRYGFMFVTPVVERHRR
jgi:hypothetical protein